MPWGAAIAAVGALGAADMQGNAAKDAAKAQNKQSQAAIDEQRAAREQFQQNIDPYLSFGQQGITGLQGLLANPDSIQDSAAYQWRYNQGLQALDRSAAAGGSGLYSGAHQKDLLGYGQGLASQEYADQWNRLANIASMGQNAAVGAGSMAQSTANSLGSIYGQMGQANANAAIGQANAYGNALNGLAGIAGQYFGNRSGGGGTSYQQTGWGAFTPNTGGGYDSSGINPQANQWSNWGAGWA